MGRYLRWSHHGHTTLALQCSPHVLCWRFLWGILGCNSISRNLLLPKLKPPIMEVLSSWTGHQALYRNIKEDMRYGTITYIHIFHVDVGSGSWWFNTCHEDLLHLSTKWLLVPRVLTKWIQMEKKEECKAQNIPLGDPQDKSSHFKTHWNSKNKTRALKDTKPYKTIL